jgi:hypothetical protein
MDLNSIAILVSILSVAGSIVYACIRVGMVAGRTDNRLGSLTDGLSALTESLQAFADKADDRLNKHGERLAALEARRHVHARAED